MESKVVQIRKKGGLDKIVKNKSGSTINPMLFRSKTKNRNEEGEIEGDYRGRSLLDTKHFISPIWSDLKKAWSFEGSPQDLTRLIEAMRLRYPKNHPQEGQFIKGNAEEDSARLINRKDPVFNHKDLYGKYYMEFGRVSLDLSKPDQEFLYRCYRGSEVTDSREAGDAPVSKYISAGTKYQIVSPRNETKKAKVNADKEVKAITLLAAMDKHEERMRAVARIMELPQYAESTDASGVFVLLKDMAAQNVNMSSKYGKTYQDRFIELAELADEDLNITDQVWLGKTKGILRKRTGHYLFNGEKLDGLDTDIQLVNYFRNPKNTEQYLKLVNLLEDGGKF